MDFIKAVSIIGRDLEEALALLDQLSAIKSTHTAEIELARSRVRSASDLLRLLPGLDRVKSPEIESEAAAETATVVTVVQEPQEIQEQQKVQEQQKIQEQQKVQVSEVLSAEVPAQELQKTRKPLKAPETQRSILADRFASAGTIGEKMQSAKQDEAITSVMHGKAITDIATAIGMNDRFYFIRELFSGDTIAYHDTIRRLNAAASLGEAMRILDESTVMGSDPAAQSSFVDVVRRKFSLNV